MRPDYGFNFVNMGFGKAKLIYCALATVGISCVDNNQAFQCCK